MIMKKKQILIFTSMLKRRLKVYELKYAILWLLSIFTVVWVVNNSYYSYYSEIEQKCNRALGAFKTRIKSSTVEYMRLSDDVTDQSVLGLNEHDILTYNRNLPLIFIGGMPRSGTTLMRAMLDAHPKIRCGEETRVVPRIIFMRNQWNASENERRRLINAGMTDDIIDSAISSFVLEVCDRFRFRAGQ